LHAPCGACQSSESRCGSQLGNGLGCGQPQQAQARIRAWQEKRGNTRICAGRVVVHGGLADQKVLGQAVVLEVQDGASQWRGESAAGTATTAASASTDLLSVDTSGSSAAARDPFAHVAPSGGTLPRHLKPQICSIMVTCTATPAALRGQPRAHLLLRWPEFCCKHPGCRLGSSPGMCCSGSAALPRNPVSAGCATVWWPRAWHQPALPTFQHCIRTICSASATPCIYHHRIPAKKLHTMSCSKP
jgi:hypothetical protein